MKYITFILLFFSSLLFAQQKPNIVFILADDIGNGEVGYNNSDWHTPNIDSLAARGVKFTNYYTSPSCTPTRAMLTTGKNAHKLGLQWGTLWPYDGRSLPVNEKLLPEYLKEEGYTTALVGKWNLGLAFPEQSPNARGFDYAIHYPSGPDYESPISPNGPWHNWIENNRMADWPDGSYLTELEGTKAREWVQDQVNCAPDHPFFLYWAANASHSPLQAPLDTINLAPVSFSPEKKIKWAMTRILDNEIGKLLDLLETNGVDSNTIIIFASDNGGDLPTSPGGTDLDGDNSPYTGQKTQLYDGGVRVPMIWTHPGTVTRGQTIDSLITVVDWLPTVITGVLGRQIIDPLDGYNFYNLLGGSGGFPSNRSWVYIATTEHWMVVQDGFKYCNNCAISQVTSNTSGDDKKLFDLSSNDETTNVAGTYPAKVTALQAIYDSEVSNIVPVGTQNQAKPGGWVDTPCFMCPEAWYNPNYFYYRGN